MIKFSEEQAMLLETANDFCQNTFPVLKVRALFDSDQGFEDADWQSMVELGWLGIAVPEAYGGLDMGLASVVPVVEAQGKALANTPFVMTTLATQALILGGSEAQKTEWLPKIVEGAKATLALTEEDGSWLLEEVTAKGEVQGDKLTLSGTKCFVQDAPVSDLIIASVAIDDEAKLVAIPKDVINPANMIREVVIDEGRRAYRLILDGISVSSDAILPNNCFKALEQAAILLNAADMTGGLSSCLKTIVEYLNTRKQFERLIGSYQALKHPTVDILLSLEEAKSHLYHAATLMAEPEVSEKKLEIALRMAKAISSEAFAFAGDRAVQFHGGMGFTHECDAQLYLRRALWGQYQFGDERYQRQLLAPLLLDD